MQLICGLTPQAFGELFTLFLVVAAVSSLVWHSVGDLVGLLTVALVRAARRARAGRSREASQ